MSVPRDHHHLPQFMLKGWCNPITGKVTIYTRRDVRVVVSERIPKYTGYERDLYTYRDVPTEKRTAIETDFMTPKIDTPASIILQKMTDRGSLELTDDEKETFARFILSLRLRHPDAIAKIREQGHEQLRAEAIREGSSQPIDPALIHNFGLFIVPHAIADPKIVDRICTMPWWVVDVRHANTDLIISDRPCLLEGNAMEGNCLLVLPLNPITLLVISNDPTKVEKLYSINISDLVSQINFASVYYASERVYTTGRQHAPLIEKLLGFRKKSNVF